MQKAPPLLDKGASTCSNTIVLRSAKKDQGSYKNLLICRVGGAE
jgi:hypothetical protein